MKRIIRSVIIAVAVLTVSAQFSFAQLDGGGMLRAGINSYQEGDFEKSLLYFRDIVIEPSLKEFHADGYFWTGKTCIALGRYDEAEENIEFFLAKYPDHWLRSEALYHKGRLMYLQGDYENAVQESRLFIAEYPDSPFAANSYFWAAESMFLLGQLEQAEKLFTHIVFNYPSSYKIEAARYRLDLIEQKYREDSLKELLKLTHQEYLQAMEEYQVRERTYETALDSYQKRLASIEAGTAAKSGTAQGFSSELLDLQTKLRSRDTEIMALKRKIAELEYRLENAEAKVAAEKKVIEVVPEQEDLEAAGEGMSMEDRLELMDIRSRALEIKSFYLEQLNTAGGTK